MEDIELAINLWKRLEESLQDKDSLRCMQRIRNNADMLCALMLANDVITEGKKEAQVIKAMNKKLSMSTHSHAVDNALVFIFLKGLTTLPTKTKAFKLGLIDHNGKLIRKPKTKEEIDSISNLDLLMFRIRKWMTSKLQYLSSISWIKSAADSIRFQNYFSNCDTVERQYVVRKINDELDRLLSKD